MSKRLEEEFYRGLVGEEKTAAPAPVQAQEPEPQPAKITSKNLFSHPETHPVVLDLALLRFFHLEWFSWLPETLFHEIEQTFKTSIAEVNRLKILAAQVLHVSDAFWEQWEVFEKLLHSVNGVIPIIGSLQPPDLSHLLAGVDTVNLIRKEEFGEEVARYVAACCLNEHVSWAPSPIEFAQPYLSEPYYICNDCGKKGSALPPFDGFCDSCSHKFDQEHPFSLKPDPEIAQKGGARNLRLGMEISPDETKKRFIELDKMPPDKVASAIREVPEDIEAARIIVAVDFQKFRTKQLQEQLSSLGTWLGASS